MKTKIISIKRNDDIRLYICDYFCTSGGNIKGFTIDARKVFARKLDDYEVELIVDFLNDISCLPVVEVDFIKKE